MIFNSQVFLIFFMLFFPTYWVVSRRASVKWRNVLLIIGSYVFYGWWDWRFLSLIIVSSTADFIIGQHIYRSGSDARKKYFLIFSLAINLGLLGFFKYFNFFLDTLKLSLDFMGVSIHTASLEIILPVGISFYTFQTMSYTIDIYKGRMKPTKDAFQFFAFVAFFPQLVAGPIERARRFLPQFGQNQQFDAAKATSGLRLMLWGFFKKIVIADNLAVFVDHIFDHPEGFSAYGILLGGILFAFQIYCDFSGYSDIAIGLGKTMGFDLVRNFDKPYLSKSFSEFWRRWHISLSTWFRDYVYIPLGGNRLSGSRTNINLLVTFVLSGLWHGANFTFLIWGFLHGIMLILEKRLGTLKHGASLFIFLISAILWIPFRATSFSNLKLMAVQLLKLGSNDWQGLALMSPARIFAIGILLLTFIISERKMGPLNFNEAMEKLSRPARRAIYIALAICILLLVNLNVKPNFIYFQF